MDYIKKVKIDNGYYLFKLEKILKEAFELGMIEVGFYTTGESLLDNNLSKYITKRWTFVHLFVIQLRQPIFHLV